MGGGLSGITAALLAHKAGHRDTIIYERAEALGGVARSTLCGEFEVRTGTLYFGDTTDPQLALLQSYGSDFTAFPNQFGSINPHETGKPFYTDSFGGPVIPCGQNITLFPNKQANLYERLSQYPPNIAMRMLALARKHVDVDPVTLSAEAVIPMALNRLIPLDADAANLARLKSQAPLYDDLYGLPRNSWGYARNQIAHLPTDGFLTFFSQLEETLTHLGITCSFRKLLRPAQAEHLIKKGDSVFWGVNPLPLFPYLGIPVPETVQKTFYVYSFLAESSLTSPYYLQSFLPHGSIFRLYIYSSGPAKIVTLECMQPATEVELRSEVSELINDTPIADLQMGENIASVRQARWLYHSTETISALKSLRSKLSDRFGTAFLCGNWEDYAKGAKYTGLQKTLTQWAGQAV
nr:NAD(P)/FAD-dependent oxidoreductase [Asticcacaulis tiandongensis]